MPSGRGDPTPPIPARLQAQPQVQPEVKPEPQITLQLPVRWPSSAPRPSALLATIRKLAKERRVGFLEHSEMRMAERGFDVFDIYDALGHGQIDGPIEAGKKEGEWKVKVAHVPEGASRRMGVVTIVVKEQRLLIKTVEWEDR